MTVDCGILAHSAVQEAQDLGLDVIVTDHHAPGEDLPPALAVLNPARVDSAYPNPDLCGTGVAYKLCQGLARAGGFGEEELHPFLDLVGLATVADLVPLKGENRILARFGLKTLARTENPGLKALMAGAGVSREGISAGTVGFGLAPRLNALGRLGEAQDGLRLLLTDDQEEAVQLARTAEDMNGVRQEADRRTLDEALNLVGPDLRPGTGFRGGVGIGPMAPWCGGDRRLTGGGANSSPRRPFRHEGRSGKGERTVHPGVPPPGGNSGMRLPSRTVRGPQAGSRHGDPGGTDPGLQEGL